MMDGLRASLTKEFSSIWIFNARGNQRTSGETSRMEAGKIFGSGSRAPIALTLLVKDPAHEGPCELKYHDIGDYLSREQKLEIIRGCGGVANVDWATITPNAEHDWIDQRDPVFEKFVAIGDRSDKEGALFEAYSMGTQTIGDAWMYNSSRGQLLQSVSRFINTYNDEETRLRINSSHTTKRKVQSISGLESDPTRIKWSGSLLKHLEMGVRFVPHATLIRESMYRPFFRQWLYFDPVLLHRVGLAPTVFPNEKLRSRIIDVTGIGVNKPFTVFMSDLVSDMQMMPNGQTFPLNGYKSLRQ